MKGSPSMGLHAAKAVHTAGLPEGVRGQDMCAPRSVSSKRPHVPPSHLRTRLSNTVALTLFVAPLVLRCSGMCLMTDNSINVCRYSYAAAAIGIVAAVVMLCAMVRWIACGVPGMALRWGAGGVPWDEFAC